MWSWQYICSFIVVVTVRDMNSRRYGACRQDKALPDDIYFRFKLLPLCAPPLVWYIICYSSLYSYLFSLDHYSKWMRRCYYPHSWGLWGSRWYTPTPLHSLLHYTKMIRIRYDVVGARYKLLIVHTRQGMLWVLSRIGNCGLSVSKPWVIFIVCFYYLNLDFLHFIFLYFVFCILYFIFYILWNISC